MPRSEIPSSGSTVDEPKLDSLSAPATRRPDSELDLAGRHRLASVVSSLTGKRDRPEHLGRFELRRLLGEGAFGEVYLGFDPDLQRPVALKLLKRSATEDSLRRLKREAQAMAALEHPALLTVFEIGVADGRAFVAMELAEQGTLREWVDAQPRSFEAIASQIERAARALAVAHDAGFVHRDVKPTNLLVGADGLARVSDFGLVHVELADADGADSSQRTAMAGTPAYMAPEQFDAAEPTGAADQYALCVTLYELVYGQRPTRRPPAIEDIEVPPLRETEPRRVPAWLRAVLTRGLRFDPAQRFVDMRRLADTLAIGIDTRRRLRRRLTIGAAIVTAAGVGWAVRPNGPPPCRGATAKLAGVWDDARRAEVREALQATGVPYAATVEASTVSALDDWAKRWSSMYREACEATTVRGEQSAETLDLRMACLDRTLADLRAATEVLALADASVLDRALNVVPSPSSLDPCEDLDALRAGVAPPSPDEREEVGEIQALIGEARAEQKAGHFDAAVRLGTDARKRAESIQHAPTHADALIGAGEVLQSRGQIEDARVAYREGLQLAASARQWQTLGAALLGLLQLADEGEIGVDSDALESIALGLVQGRPLARAELQLALTALRLKHGDIEGAEAEVRAALATLRERLGDVDDTRLARAHNYLAGVLDSRGAFAESEAELRQAMGIYERLLGEAHPTTLEIRRNLFVVLHRQGKLAEAEAELHSLIAARQAAFGASHPEVALVRADLARVLDARGHHREAEVEQRAALKILEAKFGVDAPRLGPEYESLGLILANQNELDEAIPWLRRAVACTERFVADEHPQLAMMRAGLAIQLAIHGQRDEARALATKAWAAVEHADVPPAIRGHCAYALGRVTWSDDAGDRLRARELVQTALAIVEPSGLPAEYVAEIRTWLADHPAPVE